MSNKSKQSNKEVLKKLASIDWTIHTDRIKQCLNDLKSCMTDDQVETLLNLRYGDDDLTGVYHAISDYHRTAVSKTNEAPVEDLDYWKEDFKIYDDADDYCVDTLGIYVVECNNPNSVLREFEQYTAATKLLKKWGGQAYLFDEDKYRGVYFVVDNPNDYTGARQYSTYTPEDAKWFGEHTGMKWWRVVGFDHDTNKWETLYECDKPYQK